MAVVSRKWLLWPGCCRLLRDAYSQQNIAVELRYNCSMAISFQTIAQ